VLDIGADDGFFSFEAERRGAARVLATDGFEWSRPGGDARRNFELAHEVLDSSVETQLISVEELSPDLLDVEVPAMACSPGGSLNNDTSNFFAPDLAGLDGLLLDAGFSQVTVAEPWTRHPRYGLQSTDPDKADEAEAAAPRPRSGRAVAFAAP
jgi:hypothetical protein